MNLDRKDLLALRIVLAFWLAGWFIKIIFLKQYLLFFQIFRVEA